MNAIGPALSALPIEPFAIATSGVNEWRGRCLDAFSRAEAAVTECLAVMSACPGRGSGVRLPHLVGERLASLTTLVDADGAFASEGAAVAASLAQFRAHDRLRTMLCHGTATVTLDPRGRWTAVFRLVALRSGRVTRDTLALTEAEAAELQRQLSADARRLCSQVGQIRAKLTPA